VRVITFVTASWSKLTTRVINSSGRHCNVYGLWAAPTVIHLVMHTPSTYPWKYYQTLCKISVETTFIYNLLIFENDFKRKCCGTRSSLATLTTQELQRYWVMNRLYIVVWSHGKNLFVLRRNPNPRGMWKGYLFRERYVEGVPFQGKVCGRGTFSGNGMWKGYLFMERYVRGCRFSKFNMWKGPDSPIFSMWKGKRSWHRAEHPRIKSAGEPSPPPGLSVVVQWTLDWQWMTSFLSN